MTVGCNIPGLDAEAKRIRLMLVMLPTVPITSLALIYLRDNMAYAPEQRVQRPLNYALVDEVDSVLIDEARTPLIISGQAEDSSELYRKIDGIIPKLELQEKEDTEDYTGDGHFTVDLRFVRLI